MKTKDLLSRFAPFPNDNLNTVDLRPILDECMGDCVLLGELISLYHRNSLEFIGAAKIHLHNSDFKALGLAAHKIKAGLAMLRTDSLHAIVVLIQKECEGDRDHKHLQFLYDCYISEYPTVKKTIDMAYDTLQKG